MASQPDVPSITVSYTAQDLVDAFVLNWRRAILGLKFWRLIAVCGTLLGAFYIWLAKISGGSLPAMALAFIGGYAAFALFLLCLSALNRLLQVPRTARRAFSQMKEYHAPWTVTVHGDELHIANSRATAVLPYSDFVKWDENAKTFLLYRTDRQFNLIPQSAMTAGQRDALMAALAAAGVPRASFRLS